MHGVVSSQIISSVFMGLSQCTFFFRSESIDTFLKFLNTRTKLIFIALDKTHISTSTIFTKFTVFQNGKHNFPAARLFVPHRHVWREGWRGCRDLCCEDIAAISSMYLRASSGSDL